MEDEQQPNQPHDTSWKVYPEVTAGQLAEVREPAPSQAVVQNASYDPTSEKPFTGWTFILLGLMLLTFFTPLGSMLFLPILIVGIVAAFRFMGKTNPRAARNDSPGVRVVRGIIIGAGFLALAFVGFIALAFIAIASSPRGFGS